MAVAVAVAVSGGVAVPVVVPLAVPGRVRETFGGRSRVVRGSSRGLCRGSVVFVKRVFFCF